MASNIKDHSPKDLLARLRLLIERPVQQPLDRGGARRKAVLIAEVIQALQQFWFYDEVQILLVRWRRHEISIIDTISIDNSGSIL
jgi:hypothetical protein